MDRKIKKFYKRRGTPLKDIVRIGKSKGYIKDSLVKAAELLYYERDKWPPQALVMQVYCRARHLHPKYISWGKRKWWKKLIQAIFFPQTLIWDYDKWHI